MTDPDNPEWTTAEVSAAPPAQEVLPELFGQDAASSMLRPRGRPLATTVKERTTIRLSPDVMAAFKASGKGWQTRMNDALKDWLQTHAPI
ncbi:MAG: BrnA antitoxin family protein [Rhodoferax sp.]|nr:BrnA antitoxin family protein [Rhodoferax sp.]